MAIERGDLGLHGGKVVAAVQLGKAGTLDGLTDLTSREACS
jgi:hypothetical protein